MTEREQFEFLKSKRRIFDRDEWTCQKCGKVAVNLAHRIAQSKVNLKLYGKEVIHHDNNLVAVCNSSYCNSSFNIGNNPEKVKEVVEKCQKKRL